MNHLFQMVLSGKGWSFTCYHCFNKHCMVLYQCEKNHNTRVQTKMEYLAQNAKYRMKYFMLTLNCSLISLWLHSSCLLFYSAVVSGAQNLTVLYLNLFIYNCLFILSRKNYLGLPTEPGILCICLLYFIYFKENLRLLSL